MQDSAGTPGNLDDVRYLREVVGRTSPPARGNRYWPVTLSWGITVALGYAICVVLARTNHEAAIPWVMPVVICGLGWPLHFVLVRNVRRSIEREGRRPRFRPELALPWIGIVGMGLLGTAWLIASGMIVAHWYLIPFLWGALNFVGYVLNGALLANEWYWAAGALLGAMVVTAVAGPLYYGLCAVWIPGTLILPGVMGYLNARRQTAEV